MSDYLNHDQIIAKIQHFADFMTQKKLEKEALSIVLDKSDLKSCIISEILIYQEIIEEYYTDFEHILHR